MGSHVVNFRYMNLVTLYLLEILRNPWVWPAGLSLLLLGTAFQNEGGTLGLISVISAASLFVPPLVLVLAVPLLTRRDTWACWSGLADRPGFAYTQASIGVALGTFVPLTLGLALAAIPLALSGLEVALFVLTIGLLTALWTAVATLASALTLDAARALALGVALWALVTLTYGPSVVAIAMGMADRPTFGLLATALLLNPMEAVRVGLLELQSVPILVGPTAVLIKEVLPGPSLVWGVASSVAWTLFMGWLAALVFWWRNR